MLRNYIKIAARVLLRHKLYTFINVFGLSLGIACCILILLFVRNELSYDSFHKQGDTIYRVLQASTKPNKETDLSAYEPMPLAPALRAEYPEVVHAARFAGGELSLHRETSPSPKRFCTPTRTCFRCST